MDYASDSESVSVVGGSDASDGSDEDDEAVDRPYLALMRSFAQSTPRKAKRRKLEHSELRQESHEDVQQSASREEQDPESADPIESPEQDQDEPLLEEEDLFDNDDDLDSTDPFEVHFANPNEDAVLEKVKAIQSSQWLLNRVAVNQWRVFMNCPQIAEPVEVTLPKPFLKPADLKLKRKLKDVAITKKPEFDALEGLLSSLLFNHYDTLFCERTITNANNLRWIVCLHALNHIFK